MSAAPATSRPSPRITSPLSLLLGLAVTAGAALPAGAQAALEDKEVAEYRLTEGALRKVIKATTDMVELVKSDKNLAKQLADVNRAEEKKDEEDEDVASVAEIVAIYDRLPPIRRAITSAGMTPKEFVTFHLALALAGLAQWAVDQGASAAEMELTPVQKANMAFYKRHEADFKRLDQLTKALNPEEKREDPDTPPPAAD